MTQNQPPFQSIAQPAKPTHPTSTESSLTKEQEQKTEALKAANRKTHAEAQDQETLTALKEKLAYRVVGFMFVWCGLIFVAIFAYFYSLISLDKEIPKEVILGMFTATTVVIGLVGYILKGLFGNSGAPQLSKVKT